MSVDQLEKRLQKDELKRLKLRRDTIECDRMAVNIKIRKMEERRDTLRRTYKQLEEKSLYLNRLFSNA
ncbi:hypothetical protein V6R21_00165 [Limibacter armeniacum]|uniref:hypothetical protein n=1 Tax=Limibacter armeniacum TaxID=466084 RepID=UPI002FE68EDD